MFSLDNLPPATQFRAVVYAKVKTLLRLCFLILAKQAIKQGVFSETMSNTSIFRKKAAKDLNPKTGRVIMMLMTRVLQVTEGQEVWGQQALRPGAPGQPPPHWLCQAAQRVGSSWW